jgi:host factor-I protein
MAEQGNENLQNSFFTRISRTGERVSIFLLNGKRITGRIKSFDRYTLLIDAGRSEEVIFKHAISSVSIAKAGARPKRQRSPRREDRSEGRSRPQAPPSEGPLSHRMDLSTALKTTPQGDARRDATSQEGASEANEAPLSPASEPRASEPSPADPSQGMDRAEGTGDSTPPAEPPPSGSDGSEEKR